MGLAGRPACCDRRDRRSVSEGQEGNDTVFKAMTTTAIATVFAAGVMFVGPAAAPAEGGPAPVAGSAETAGVCKSWRNDWYRNIGTHYPVRLFGVRVHLVNGASRNYSHAIVYDGLRPGDQLAIQRAKNFTTTKRWWTTGELGRRGIDYDTCVGSPGRRSPLVQNWHVPVRVCMYRHGFRACSNWWYADTT